MSAELFQILMPMLFTGLRLTILIAVMGIIFAFIVGSLVGYALQCRVKILKVIADAYIWVIRGIPLVVLALYTYFVLPKMIGVDLQPTTVGIIVISLNEGAFIAEIVRGALQSVDPGQREAGLSLGLSPAQTLFHVIVPPAFRSMLPALCNQFIIAVKDTALLSIINVNEVTHLTQNYAALSYNTIPAYTVLALFYLAIISVLIVLQKQVEKKMRARI